MLIQWKYFSATWYKGQLTDEELEALENPPTTRKPDSGAPQRRKKPHRPSLRDRAVQE